MSRVPRILFRLAAGVLCALVLGLGAVYAAFEWQMRDVPDTEAFAVPIPTDSASIERGRHVARTRGCFGCHGQDLSGRVYTDEWPWVKRAVAPNLAILARENDAIVLERAIRRGVGRDGRALWSMPSYNWTHLSDDDVSTLIAFLRSAPVVEQPLPTGDVGWRARWDIGTGKEGHMVDWGRSVPPLLAGPDEEPALRRGEYLAMTACNECHGLDLRGANNTPGIATPDLAIVAGYSWEEFNTLLSDGRARDGRDSLGLMTVVAGDRFVAFGEEERADLYHFLQSLPDRPIATDVFWRVASDNE